MQPINKKKRGFILISFVILVLFLLAPSAMASEKVALGKGPESSIGPLFITENFSGSLSEGHDSLNSIEASVSMSVNKLTESPNIEWEKTFGGSYNDWGHSVQQTGDGGYIVTGATVYYGDDVYLIKTDADDNRLWEKAYGGYNGDGGYSVQQTGDSGYIIAGCTYSYGAGDSDIYLIKTDTAGNKLWQKTFGGIAKDMGYSVQQTRDRGYIVAGFTDSFGAGGWDAYLVKLKGCIASTDTLGKRPYCLYGRDSVNLSTGNFILEETDLAIPSIGPSLEITRFYNSTDTYKGPLGQGWTHNFNTHLIINNDQSITVAYADGHTALFTYNGGYQPPVGCFETLVAGPDNTYVLTFKDQTRYTYNAAGQLVSIIDKNSNTLNLSYSDGLLASATEPAGRSLTFSYNADRRLTGVTDPAGRTVAYDYDSSGNLATVKDVRNNITQYNYDNFGLTEIIDPDGKTLLSNAYDICSRVIRQTDGNGNITDFNYDQANQTVMTDAMGNTITAEYDVKYRCTDVSYPGNITETFAYDDNNCRTGLTDALNRTTTCSYDDFGNLLNVTDPAGNKTVMTYDGNNNLLSVINAAGKQISFTYENNNLTGLKDPFGFTTTYQYYSNGLLYKKTTPASDTGPGSGTTSYIYQNGLLQTITDPAGNTITFDYDPAGRPNIITDAEGKITSMNYDEADNLLDVTDPLGNKTSFTYDWRGNILTETDARGNVTRYDYNGNGIIINRLDALNNGTSYEYNALNQLKKITDPRGNSTIYKL